MLKFEISGSCKVFRNDVQTKSGGTFPRYSVSIGKKLPDNAGWENAYITAQFKKGVELENMTDIDVLEGWLTFDKVKQGDKATTYWKIFVNDFETIEEQGERMTRNAAPATDAAFASADDEDIPW